jgi:hypothetical protein
MDKRWEVEVETDEVEFVSYDTVNESEDNDGWDEQGYDVNYDDKTDWS